MSAAHSRSRTRPFGARLGRPRAGRGSDRKLAITLALGACMGALGCTDNPGISPAVNELFFPSGLVLDPRAAADTQTPVRYLLVVNGNNDLSFNAGSVVAIDVDRFFASWADDDQEGVYPYCEPVGLDAEQRPTGRCVLAPGSKTDAQHPCRRLAFNPSVVECDERPFVVDSVQIGDFATVAAATVRSAPRVFIPVRGDPSITYFDVKDAAGGEPDLDCGQARDARGRAADASRCADAFRLTHLRNDDALDRLVREPFNIIVTETDDYAYAFVAHAAGGGLTLVDLAGLQGGDGRPAIVESNPVFFNPIASGSFAGGFGLATRPCSIEDDNAPSLTQSCRRPLVYGSLRWELSITSFSASGLTNADLPGGDLNRHSCYGPDGDGDGDPDFLGPFCAGPDEVDEPCAILCEPQVQGARRIPLLGLDPLSPASQTAFGDIGFADESGEELYVVQSNPGALLTVDTSLDVDQSPRNVQASPPIELCAEPTRMKIWNGLAFVSCFRSAYIFVIDLQSHRVIQSIITGTGPHDLLVDPGRRVLFAANTLEKSVSVIDIDQTRRTGFTEIARIGLQEPFSP